MVKFVRNGVYRHKHFVDVDMWIIRRVDVPWMQGCEMFQVRWKLQNGTVLTDGYDTVVIDKGDHLYWELVR